MHDNPLPAIRPKHRAVVVLTLLLASLPCSGRTENRADPHSIDVGPALQEELEADWLDRDGWYQIGGSQTDIPHSDNPQAVTTRDDAAGACDGIKNGRNGFHTASGETDAWWQVDLGKACTLDRVVVFNRTDGNTAPRTRHIRILTTTDLENPAFKLAYQHNGDVFYGVKEADPLVVDFQGQNLAARIVRLQVPGRCSFALDEVEVYSTDDPNTNIALRQPADQKSVSPHSKPSPARPKRGEEAPRPVVERRFAWKHTQEVLGRAQQLARRMEQLGAGEQVQPFTTQLKRIQQQVTALAAQDTAPEAVRQKVYLEACRLARKIAFCNPLLDFDKILFIKRQHPGGLYHMVHQYYGFCAEPGGGLFVLSAPFSDNPRLTNLLDASAVVQGRLKGKSLKPGSFLSPDLSYDGQRILFAYTEAKADGIEWSPRASYHIFRVNADGSDLVQLTDGRWNDFDPCFLPNGRVVFVSERRGGYLRCGGSAPPYDSPTYTLHAMSDTGQDITCLSFHETQEWHPSVTNDGMIAYTRWDYVDRDTNVAHHIWTCYPDGRDPRSFHGNYPTRRESRPWMEMSIRAIPGSKKFVTTAAAHHGHAFGSLVMIDPHAIDDGVMSQLTRLTPDVPFPESEGGKSQIRQHMVYGTAWPLSEDDYLCVYDRHAKNHGVYWIDRFGNRELLYRDPSVPCLSPIPLRPRWRPPAITQQPSMAANSSDGKGPTTASVAVMNVYDSDFEWPQGTRVDALRIIHVLPKTTPPSNQPRIGVGTQTNARAVLGTVPVESDGSAYFEAPAGRTIYFQALDEQGLAVQSMRSGTYLHPGEHLTCQGCHEPKRRAPANGRNVPLALRRPPSKIQPEADGSNPFSYVRLVQPVLDRHCVACHQQRKALDLSGSAGETYGWSKSYANLAEKYGFFFHVTNGSIKSGVHGGSRTIPGQFGARAAPLRSYLDERHYGVELKAEERRRITLWLDSNSEFYGAYEKTLAQARGEVVYPSLD